METKYIFVTGGVVSSLGKGIISASIGKLLQARGYKVELFPPVSENCFRPGAIKLPFRNSTPTSISTRER